jgi:hypothetical protein
MARHQEEEWQRVYAAAFAEQDPTKQIELCERARRLILDKQVELAAQRQRADPSLQEALRSIWKLQHKAESGK